MNWVTRKLPIVSDSYGSEVASHNSARFAHLVAIHTISIIRATSPRHSEHTPCSTKSPPATVPAKSVMGTSWESV
jgi:hypothetical protein